MTYRFDTHMATLRNEFRNTDPAYKCCGCGGPADGNIEIPHDDAPSEWVCAKCDEEWMKDEEGN